MLNQQLLDYIKQCQAQGLTDEAIKKALADTGWSQVDIEAGFGNNSSIPVPIPMNQAGFLPDPTFLLKESWLMLKQRSKTFASVLLLPYLLGLLAVYLFGASMFGAFYSFGTSFLLIFSVYFIFIALVLWSHLAFLQVIKDWQENIDVATAYRRSAEKILSILWVTVLITVIVTIGFFLLFFPGIWLSISLGFAIMICFFEGSGGSEALRQSYKLVSGRWWSVFWYLAVASLLFFLIFLPVSVVSMILGYFSSSLDWQWQIIINIIFSGSIFFCLHSLMTIYNYKIYQSLRLAKPKA